MRFCADCMTDMGLNPEDSKLALRSCASHRLVLCDGPRHSGRMIMVDSDGLYVPQELHAPVLVGVKDVKPGHSLTRV